MYGERQSPNLGLAYIVGAVITLLIFMFASGNSLIEIRFAKPVSKSTSYEKKPNGSPVPNPVLTQGYGVGTHAPAHIWGAIDLACGDEAATNGQPVWATHSGRVTVSMDTYPGGNHVWVENSEWRTGYAHLRDVTVTSGSSVNPGDQIGTIGNTGMSFGSHLDYQVWQKINNEWVNVNPLEVANPLNVVKYETINQTDVVSKGTWTAQDIDTMLADAGSPAQGTGHIWVREGQRWGINHDVAVAFFWHESNFGTAPGWAGHKPDGTTTHNPGNIICAGYSRCYGRFRDYASWEEGIEDWYRLIRVEYVDAGLDTLEEIVPVYAPSFENDVQGYVRAIEEFCNEGK